MMSVARYPSWKVANNLVAWVRDDHEKTVGGWVSFSDGLNELPQGLQRYVLEQVEPLLNPARLSWLKSRLPPAPIVERKFYYGRVR